MHIRGGCSVFDNIAETDIVMAFFPCFRFEDQIALSFRGDQYQMKNYSDQKKIEHTMRLAEERSQLFALFLKMSAVALKKRIRLIIENPYSAQHYLTQYFPIRPKIIDRDRTERGDFWKKPTQYWFINCEPENNLVMECNENIEFIGRIERCVSKDGISRRTMRSMISPQYAEHFVKEFILDEEHTRQAYIERNI